MEIHDISSVLFQTVKEKQNQELNCYWKSLSAEAKLDGFTLTISVFASSVVFDTAIPLPRLSVRSGFLNIVLLFCKVSLING